MATGIRDTHNHRKSSYAGYCQSHTGNLQRGLRHAHHRTATVYIYGQTRLVSSVIRLAFAGVSQHLVGLQQCLKLSRGVRLLGGVADVVRVEPLRLTSKRSLQTDRHDVILQRLYVNEFRIAVCLPASEGWHMSELDGAQIAGGVCLDQRTRCNDVTIVRKHPKPCLKSSFPPIDLWPCRERLSIAETYH